MDQSKKKVYADELLKVIQDYQIGCYTHAFAYTSFSQPTAYIYELEKLEAIKSAIAKNRASHKAYMLKKWIDSDNATLNLAAFRLLAEPEEHRMLNQSYIDHTTKGDKIGDKIDLSKYTDEELRTLAELQRKGRVSEA
jgi:hypothetical protein